MVKVYFLQSEKQDATNITALSKYILASGHGGKQTATQLPCVHKTIMLLCFYLFDFGTFCGAEHFETFCCAKIDFCTAKCSKMFSTTKCSKIYQKAKNETEYFVVQNAPMALRAIAQRAHAFEGRLWLRHHDFIRNKL